MIPGQVIVNSIVCRWDMPDFGAWEIDCATKYGRVTIGSGDDEHVLLLYADEHTLRADESTDQATVVKFPLIGDWTMLVDGGRYSFYIAAYRRMEGEIVWQSESRDPGTEGES